MTLSPGTTVDGKYRIERVIGEGGMGMVVAAEHLHVGHRVAIKFLHAGAGRNARERFEIGRAHV